MRWATWRNAVVLSATCWVVGYLLAVTIHVRSTPDIGLHTNMTPTVGRVFPQLIRDAGGSTPAELAGCTIVEVDGRPIETWPQYLRVLRELDRPPTERSIRR